MECERYKTEIIQMVKGLQDEIMRVNDYLVLLFSYSRIRDDGFESEYDISSTFHAVVQDALFYSMCMTLAKLYESSSKSAISIESLISFCLMHIEVFPEKKSIPVHYIDMDTDSSNDGVELVSWTCNIWKEDYVRFQDDGRFQKWFPKSVDDVENWPYKFCGSPKEILYILQYRKKLYNSITEKLRHRRNKFYAHNDRILCFDFSKLDYEYDILWKDLVGLADFAYEVCYFISEALTGSVVSRNSFGIADIGDLFHMLRRGRKYSAMKRADRKQKSDCPDEIKQAELRSLDKILVLSDRRPVKLEIPFTIEGSYRNFLFSMKDSKGADNHGKEEIT